MGKLFIENTMDTTNNFLSNIRKMKENTLNFENCSYREKYTNDKIKYMESSEKNLIYFRNIYYANNERETYRSYRSKKQ